MHFKDSSRRADHSQTPAGAYNRAVMATLLSPRTSSSSPSPRRLPARHRSKKSTKRHSIAVTTPSTSRTARSSQPEELLRSSLSLTDHRYSVISHSQSRTTSTVFPIFHSSLSYAVVRDFAYPPFHPMHYGPVDEPHSEASTPTSQFDSSRRLSDPPYREMSQPGGGVGPWGDSSSQGDRLPSTSFAGDHYSDDEDPGQTGRRVSRHRRSKSYAHMEDYARGRRRSSRDGSRKAATHSFGGLNDEGMFEGGQGGATGMAAMGLQDYRNADDGSDFGLPNPPFASPPSVQQFESPLSMGSTPQQQNQHPPFREDSDQEEGDGKDDEEARRRLGGMATIAAPYTDPEGEHRPSSTSLDESFAGPSLALYEFRPENSNELALREGQIIQVGYRHGQGWLVAMDLETGEQGLVPEEYVRLLSHIEGWGEEGAEENDTNYENYGQHQEDEDTGSSGRNDETEAA